MSLLGELLRSYVVHAWPFALLHLLLMLAITRSLAELRRDREAILSWNPDDVEAFLESGVIRLLRSFASASTRMGALGTLAAIDEYAAEIRAFADVRFAAIHARINMLLVVGIAGTLFGIFEFAARSGALSGDDQLASIGALLSSSMAKAFPVGFVGLVLMLSFEFRASRDEQEYAAVAGAAIAAALDRRNRGFMPATQVLSDTAARVEVALQPLRDLRSTLAETLAPVLSTLQTTLGESLNVARAQVNAAETAYKTLAAAVGTLEANASALTGCVRDLRGSLHTLPKVMEQSVAIQEAQQRVLLAAQTLLEGSVETAERFAREIMANAEHLRDLPGQVASTTGQVAADTFGPIRDQSLATWKELFDELLGTLQREYGQHIADVQMRSREIESSLGAAAREWHRLAQSSETLLSDPAKVAVEELRAALRALMAEANDAVGHTYPQLKSDAAAMHTGMNETLDAMRTFTARIPIRTSPAEPVVSQDTRDVVAMLREIRDAVQRPPIVSRRPLWKRVLRIA